MVSYLMRTNMDTQALPQPEIPQLRYKDPTPPTLIKPDRKLAREELSPGSEF